MLGSKTHSLIVTNKTTISAIFIQTFIFKSNPTGLLPSTRQEETRSKRLRSVYLNFEMNELATNKPEGVVIIKLKNSTNTFAYFDCILSGHKLKRKFMHLDLESTKL